MDATEAAVAALLPGTVAVIGHMEPSGINDDRLDARLAPPQGGSGDRWVYAHGIIVKVAEGQSMAGAGREETGRFGACNRDRRTFVLGNSSFASDVRRREPPGNRHLLWNFVSSSKERLEQAAADWGAGRMKLPVGDDRQNPRSVLCWRAYAVSRASREQVLSGPGTVSSFVLGLLHAHLENRSPKMMANWVLASIHSRGGRFQSCAK